MERITLVLQRLSIFPSHHKGGFVELFISKRLIQGLAAAMMGMFLPIYLYDVSGDQFWFVALFFAGASLGYMLFLVPGMKLTNHLGFSRALALGAVFSVVQFSILYVMEADNYLSYLVPLLVAAIGFRVFHWVPYHVDFTMFTSGGGRGRDVSLTFATIAFMGVIGPVLGGYIVAQSGYDLLFMISMLLLCAAAISYLFVPTVEEQFTWTYFETFRNVCSPRFRNVVVGEIASGAEMIVTLVAWPVFLYTVLDGNILEVGILSTFIVAATIVIQLSVGAYLDARGENKVIALRRGSIFYALGWILKIFVLSALQVFLIGLYHNIARIFIKTPYDAILYDMSGEQGRYVDEFTVVKEIASSLGRVLALALMVILTLYVSVAWTFIIGAVASLLVNAIYRIHQTP